MSFDDEYKGASDSTPKPNKANYESFLMRKAYESAKKSGDIDSAKQKKYAEIKKKLEESQPRTQNKKQRKQERVVLDRSSLLWDVGFSPRNFENLVALSGAESNAEFYKTYGVSKTVFYSYMRGETSPTYKDWCSLTQNVLESVGIHKYQLSENIDANSKHEVISGKTVEVKSKDS